MRKLKDCVGQFFYFLSLFFSKLLNSPSISPSFLLSRCFNALQVLWIQQPFQQLFSLPLSVPWRWKGILVIECIRQLNKGCHKGLDSTARGRGTGMQSPSPFVLQRSAPNLFYGSSPFFHEQILNSLLGSIFIFLSAVWKSRKSVLGFKG